MNRYINLQKPYHKNKNIPFLHDSNGMSLIILAFSVLFYRALAFRHHPQNLL